MRSMGTTGTPAIAILAGLLTLNLLACGDDSSGPVADAGVDGGAGDDGGLAPGPSDDNPGPSNDGPGPAAPTTVTCGSETCEAPPGGFGVIVACCADEATGTCGTAALGQACMPPLTPAPDCPPVNLFGLFAAATCCTADGLCGYDGSALLGCVELSAGGMGPSVYCDGTPVETGGDGDGDSGMDAGMDAGTDAGTDAATGDAGTDATVPDDDEDAGE